MIIFIVISSCIVLLSNFGCTMAFTVLKQKKGSILSLEYGTNNTLERCFRNEDCRPDLTCKSYGFSISPPTACSASSTEPCFCFPKKPLVCSREPTNHPCHAAEACAQSTSGNIFCVGCKALIDLSERYTPVLNDSCKVDAGNGSGNGSDDDDDDDDSDDEKDDEDDSYSPGSQLSPSPAPYGLGRTEDLCSIVYPCAKDLRCVESGTPYECARFSTRCHCTTKSGNLRNCKSSNNCKRGEVCAMNTVVGNKYCISCDAAETNFYYQLENNTDCKSDSTRRIRPIPYYAEPPDGYTLDTCTHDLQCRDTLKCLDPKRKKPCSPKSGLCVCTDPVNDLRDCQSSTDCSAVRAGEVCATGVFPPINKKPKCVSHIYDQENLPLDVTVREPFPSYRNGATGDPCSGELDCARELSCTHPSNAFGGCAGRVGCTCQPIKLQVCDKDTDCGRVNEVCVRIIDSRTKPFCKSKEAIDNEFEERVTTVDTTGPVPKHKRKSRWIGESCSRPVECMDDDNFSRGCFHVLERYEACYGDRASCICKAVAQGGAKKRESVVADCSQKSDCGSNELCVQYEETVPEGNNSGFCLASTIVNSGNISYTILE